MTDTPVLGSNGKPAEGMVEHGDGTRTYYVNRYLAGQNTKAIHPDLDLIAPYMPGDDTPKPNTIRQYSNGRKTLYYINASHVGGDRNNPTCEKIYEAITLLKPKRIVLEGGGPESEAGYAAELAQRNHIAFSYGEPDDKILFDAMKEAGYSAKDVMALYLLRTIPRDRAQGMPMDEAHFAQRAEEYLGHHDAFASVAPIERLTYNEFKEIYAPRLGHTHFLEADTKDFAPYASADATYFQAMHATLNQVRERHVDTVIADNLNAPDVDKVLVVYGGAHRTMSGPVWEHALGKGTDIEPQKTGALSKKLLIGATVAIGAVITGLAADRMLNQGKVAKTVMDFARR